MNLVFELEDMLGEAKAIKSLATAIYDAMYCTCNSYEEYEAASNTVVRLADEHSKHLSELMNAVEAMQETEKDGENVSDKEKRM